MLLSTIWRPRRRRRRRTRRRLPPAMGGFPVTTSSKRICADQARLRLAPARAGPSGDLGPVTGPPCAQRPGHQSRRGRRPRSRPGLVHPGPAHRPPYRHRYGGFFPRGLGRRPAPRPGRNHRNDQPFPNCRTGAARARSNEPATTATGSRNPATAPAPATPAHPRSTSTHWHPAQHDQLKLRGIDPGLALTGVPTCHDYAGEHTTHVRWWKTS